MQNISSEGVPIWALTDILTDLSVTKTTSADSNNYNNILYVKIKSNILVF